MGERVKAVRMCKGLSETAVTSLVLYASKSLVRTISYVQDPELNDIFPNSN